MDEFITYEKIRSILINYTKSSQLQMGPASSNQTYSSTNHGSVPMEIDTFRRKGKPKGGKGKGKTKTKGKHYYGGRDPKGKGK